ncbi:TPA: undecaprenyl-diphosphate phosphatase [Stenotrophomonas maltophilia]|jgi:undecaprenyl-diphosphatase|uniref:undecaprenyl-diphosphate phosphatase n=1 Tax=Ralstonia TaxID=48736 RepID=UPI000B34014D|nr:undecaprenyl-diphosphate phosphatase [Ralstonia insidiosa]HDS1363383.1 undecaprenyl-diphosphate phosphatase [Stenotrophomonas maltophilia]MBY4704010.1 undecaprenyl-diphosphate phosphatase [Ralstonia insidiosa]HEL3837015.1 undecaprenyl-diphosphate phosphatase [Stenotrophomonas maltophilia]HEL3845656.1 undecaprenyl-diphosphate phosphatase [Stenotrophomonas maltophilia]HEL4293338.1 undecaprenyl-diphosphate phosphatase [Stenotrophomonas maltophilia]
MLDWSAIILGIIEGITEFLPISSTGHLLIAEHWLGARSDTFNIVIQAGAMLAVTIVYWRRLITLAVSWRQPENRLYIGKLALAFLITAVLGFVAKAAGLELPTTLSPVAWALIIGGIWMMAAERFSERRSSQREVTWTVAIAVGLAQIVAGIFPGTSRSGATIFAAMLTGTGDRAAATEFAFLVGIPTMYAASGYELYSQFKHGGGHEDWAALGTAFIVSTVTAFVAIKWLLSYIQTHRFTAFAIYRIALGALLLVIAGRGWM